MVFVVLFARLERGLVVLKVQLSFFLARQYLIAQEAFQSLGFTRNGSKKKKVVDVLDPQNLVHSRQRLVLPRWKERNTLVTFN